jgi:CRISPR-associated endoribonuclease Cas6
MRLLLTLRHEHPAYLPINYQYPISSWIYRTLARADQDFATWLHERGYGFAGKHYKLFTFGALRPKRYRTFRHNDRLELSQGPTELVLSFYLDEAVQHFVMGLFTDQRFNLGDSHSATRFEVMSVEVLPRPKFEPGARFRLLTPVCLSVEMPGEPYPRYRHPEEEGYGMAFVEHLWRKYQAAAAHTGGATAFELETMNWRLLSEPRSRLLDIKGIKVRGYTYDFALRAPVELIGLGYYAGFGEKNSGLGMGLAAILPETKPGER